MYNSPCLFNLNAEYIIQNARLDEAHAGIKIAGRNINNLRYPDDTTLMAESEEELKSLWRRKWQPTPVFLPGESHGRRSLVGYSPQGRKESDTTDFTFTFTVCLFSLSSVKVACLMVL